MFSKAYSLDGKTVFYFDDADNKYVATGGSFAWRLNNPGLVHSTSRFFSRPGSIGHFGHYAIFSSPEKGREALSNWLHTKKFFTGSLKTIAKHYQPENYEAFSTKLSSLTGIPVQTKVKTLKEQDFNTLLHNIEKLCGYGLEGNEIFQLMPKILGKIENGKQEAYYWIGGNIVLPKMEALQWAQTNRLDAIIVHEPSGNNYLRSRLGSHSQHIHFPATTSSKQGADSPLIRTVGTYQPGQCIWAFINGIKNTKEDALQAATKISDMTGKERVISLQNDTKGWNGAIDFGECILLKASLNLPIIHRAVNFLHYLLVLAKEENAPIIIFAHSQGGIILEHAVQLLTSPEAKQLRIFTFGGGSFIASDNIHPESHNYASAADFVCLGGSPNLQTFALKRYYAHKRGLSDAELIEGWAVQDAVFELAPHHHNIVKKFVEERIKVYQSILFKISKITIIDPDPDKRWKLEFASDCYQKVAHQLIQNYQEARHGAAI